MTSKVIASSVPVFTYISPDDLDNGVTYEADYKDTVVAASKTEYALFTATFDVFGSDPVCTAYTDKV